MRCPRCGRKARLLKKWKLKNAWIGIYKCERGHKFRAKVERR